MQICIVTLALLAGCGSTQPINITVPSPAPPTSSLKASTCDYSQPNDSACEQLPAAGSCHFHQDGQATLPDPACTPGARNPAVTPQSISTTICAKGYTKTIRPPVSYTGPLKARIMQAYGLNPADAKNYELDHLVPLEGGGAASDPANLWPQPYAPPGAHQKDDLENYLKAQACAGHADGLPQLQEAIASDWEQAYRTDNPPHTNFGQSVQ